MSKDKIKDLLFVFIVNLTLFNTIIPVSFLGIFIVVILNQVILATMDMARRKDDSTTNCHTDKKS